MATKKKTQKSTKPVTKRPTLPGYIGFTRSVFQTISTYRKPFLILLGLYVGAAMLFIGLVQQDQYQQLSDSLSTVGPDLTRGQFGTITHAVGVFGSAISGGLNTSLTELQQLFQSLIYLIMWLVVVWLLRQLLAGKIVKVRDALYNGCAPFISTLLIGLLMIAQSIPAAIGVLVFSVAARGAAVNSVVALVIGIIALVLVLVSLYWLISSVFALLIVTLPGTYPMAAVRDARRLVRGRKLPLMIRILWLGVILLVLWAVVLIPILVIDSWLNVGWLPIVPVTIQILSGFSILFATTYTYLLYRGLIDEPTK